MYQANLIYREFDLFSASAPQSSTDQLSQIFDMESEPREEPRRKNLRPVRRGRRKEEACTYLQRTNGFLGMAYNEVLVPQQEWEEKERKKLTKEPRVS